MKAKHEFLAKTKLNELPNIDISNVTDLINKDKLRTLLKIIAEEIKVSHKKSIDLNIRIFLIDIDPKLMVNFKNNKKATFLYIQINSEKNILFSHFKQEKYESHTILEYFNNYDESMLYTIAIKPFGQIVTGNFFIEYESYIKFHKIVYKIKDFLNFEDDFIDLFKEIVPNVNDFYYRNYRVSTCFIEKKFNFSIYNHFKNKLFSFDFNNDEVIFKLDRNNIVITLEDFLQHDKSILYLFIEKFLTFTGIFESSFINFLNEIKLEDISTY